MTDAKSGQVVDIQKLQRDIVERLKPLKPHEVILFGSYARGRPTEDSDVDLYVVTGDDFLPENWQQKNEIYLTVSREIRDLRSRVPIDLVVHTKKMHEKFVRLNGFFWREINQQGVRLI